jgi:hypothetical protein
LWVKINIPIFHHSVIPRLPRLTDSQWRAGMGEAEAQGSFLSARDVPSEETAKFVINQYI